MCVCVCTLLPGVCMYVCERVYVFEARGEANTHVCCIAVKGAADVVFIKVQRL